MKPLLLGALAAFLATSALIAAYWAVFLRPYDRGMDGFDLDDSDAPRDDNDWPTPCATSPAPGVGDYRRLNGDH